MRVAEFFAGIGLVRLALEPHGFQIVWANDIEPSKLRMYERNFSAADFRLGDIRSIHADDVPTVDMATASFPCTDLSLAGNRLGLVGAQSGMFWQFARILDELQERRPRVILLENVPSFATSHGGADLHSALKRLSQLGYWCDLFIVNARHFVPQSRSRLFIVGSQEPLMDEGNVEPSLLRPAWLVEFLNAHSGDVRLHTRALTLPPATNETLAHIVEHLDRGDPRWWDDPRRARFMSELSTVQRARLETLQHGSHMSWTTAFRRTRHGQPAWEIRADAISGCLRTARGGSSKQALVEAGHGVARIRWITALEYARLQGADAYDFAGVSEGRAQFGFGDAVCVPVVSWIAQAYLKPLLVGCLTRPIPPAIRERVSA